MSAEITDINYNNFYRHKDTLNMYELIILVMIIYSTFILLRLILDRISVKPQILDQACVFITG